MLKAIGLLVVGVVLVATGVAVAQTDRADGITATLAISDYRGTPIPCGGAFTSDTWLVGKLNAKATVPGTADLRVNAYRGDTGESLSKFDRVGYAAVPLNGGFRNVGQLHWFPDPEDVGEAYDWRFVLEVNGAPVSDCTVTFTRR